MKRIYLFQILEFLNIETLNPKKNHRINSDRLECYFMS